MHDYVITYEFSCKSIGSTVALGGNVEGKNSNFGKGAEPVIGFSLGFSSPSGAREEIHHECVGQGEDFRVGQGALGEVPRWEAGVRPRGEISSPGQGRYERRRQSQTVRPDEGALGRS